MGGTVVSAEGTPAAHEAAEEGHANLNNALGSAGVLSVLNSLEHSGTLGGC